MKLLTLKENTEFRRLYYQGKSVSNSSIAVYAKKNRLGCNRIGITVSVKVGNAVKRTRARRVIRDGYRSVADCIPNGYDIVLVARGKTPFMKSYDVGKAILRCIEQLEL